MPMCILITSWIIMFSEALREVRTILNRETCTVDREDGEKRCGQIFRADVPLGPVGSLGIKAMVGKIIQPNHYLRSLLAVLRTELNEVLRVAKRLTRHAFPMRLVKAYGNISFKIPSFDFIAAVVRQRGGSQTRW
ncbi:hypothetical protein BJ742DRAFT_74448 [Cladochytrium replicatum]|nr:hypothetical protein BJ742DRAFT_74448 [Cladochytrium replicatum]